MVAMAAPVDMAKHTVNMPGKMTKPLNTCCNLSMLHS